MIVIMKIIEMGVRGCFACPEGTIREFNVLGRKKACLCQEFERQMGHSRSWFTAIQ
jgi:hypothetical protein